LSKRGAIATGVGSGILGFVGGSLTSTDVKEVLLKCIDGFTRFIETQGQYASFAIVLAGGCGWFAVWAIKQLIAGKNEEINRVVKERDRLQKQMVPEWKSTAGPKKGPGRKR